MHGGHGVHVRSVETEGAAALGLGGIHGGVGVFQQCIGVGAIIGEDRDADTGGDKQFVILDHKGFAVLLQDFIGDG